jgi:hypothetical protein
MIWQDVIYNKIEKKLKQNNVEAYALQAFPSEVKYYVPGDTNYRIACYRVSKNKFTLYFGKGNSSEDLRFLNIDLKTVLQAVDSYEV